MMNLDKQVFWLVLTHVLIICLSNVLVLYPFELFGFKTTWGAFVYPFIFILTDLITRLAGQKKARKIILIAMLPGLISSYLISNYLRIAFASFCAYVLGQLLDITIFQKLRSDKNWWVAPSISTAVGNFFDTYVFFFVAFYHGSNAFLSANWLEIATFDLVFKLSLSLLTFVPLYGIILQLITVKTERAARLMQQSEN